MKRQLVAVCFLFFALCACSRVIVSKHSDYNFPPTDPSSILVYDRMAPTYPFVIIGRISLDMTWTVKPRKDEKKIQRMAAQAGADGIIITGLDINISAFNQYVTTHGYTTVAGSDLSNFAVTRPLSMFLQQSLTYGYIIKRTG
ncbi:MAG TPA: hypothetical protein VMW46_12455 [Candidatus Desulfaltia sp.]|nr:hypothetical protein [Candidatus Desulfaltia sp.]